MWAAVPSVCVARRHLPEAHRLAAAGHPYRPFLSANAVNVVSREWPGLMTVRACREREISHRAAGRRGWCNVIVGRSVTPDARLSARERRSFRRIEDATVAEDPLLELRLGLPRRRLTRTLVGLRRRSKAIGRFLARRPKSVLAAAVVLLVV